MVRSVGKQNTKYSFNSGMAFALSLAHDIVIISTCFETNSTSESPKTHIRTNRHPLGGHYYVHATKTCFSNTIGRPCDSFAWRRPECVRSTARGSRNAARSRSAPSAHRDALDTVS